ncbi:MAG: molybdopterin oxidoreductase, partial [Dehalococcoidia bacterium]|nr:molybdopterin oxidoreductase [Dehalococcoidia bacterium]
MATDARRVYYPSYVSYAWYGILGVLVLLGLYSFYLEYFKGHYLTGLTDVTPWGLYIAGFVFFFGASAGATVIGLMIYAFGREDYRPLGTRALFVSLLSLATSVLFIMVHLGSIPRALLIPWVWNNPTSMFFYTSVTYYIFGLLLLAQLYYAIKVNRAKVSTRESWIQKWLAISTFVFAL